MEAIELFEKIILRFKMVYNYFKIIIHHFFENTAVDYKSENNKIAFFDLHDRRPGRYYYTLMYFFHACGYRIIVKNNFWFIASCSQFDSLIFKIKGVQIKSSIKNTSDAIYIYDRKVNHVDLKSWRGIIKLNFDVYSEKPNNKPFIEFPFPMHPLMYHMEKYKKVDELRRSERRFRLSFSGNSNKETYSNVVIKQFFNKINRYEIVEHLKERLDSDKLVIVSDLSQLDELVNNYLNRFILFDWETSSHSQEVKARISESNWLELLSQSDFFLACPGVSMPMSHNIIECMSVGTIPLTEYPELFNPPLINNQNCIVYNGKEGLLEKIDLILKMNQNEVKALKQNVEKYYEECLSPDSFCRKLTNIEELNFTLFLNAENASFQDFLSNSN